MMRTRSAGLIPPAPGTHPTRGHSARTAQLRTRRTHLPHSELLARSTVRPANMSPQPHR